MNNNRLSPHAPCRDDRPCHSRYKAIGKWHVDGRELYNGHGYQPADQTEPNPRDKYHVSRRDTRARLQSINQAVELPYSDYQRVLQDYDYEFPDDHQTLSNILDDMAIGQYGNVIDGQVRLGGDHFRLGVERYDSYIDNDGQMVPYRPKRRMVREFKSIVETAPEIEVELALTGSYDETRGLILAPSRQEVNRYLSRVETFHVRFWHYFDLFNR